MTQATTIKKQKAQPQTANDLEITNKKVIERKKDIVYKGYKYTDPTRILIAFETSEESEQGDVRGAIHKLMNKNDKTFTAIVNDAVIEYLKINKIKIKKVK